MQRPRYMQGHETQRNTVHGDMAEGPSVYTLVVPPTTAHPLSTGTARQGHLAHDVRKACQRLQNCCCLQKTTAFFQTHKFRSAVASMHRALPTPAPPKLMCSHVPVVRAAKLLQRCPQAVLSMRLSPWQHKVHHPVLHPVRAARRLHNCCCIELEVTSIVSPRQCSGIPAISKALPHLNS